MSLLQNEWLVRIQDRPDTLQTRRANHQAHLEYLDSRVQEGRITMNSDSMQPQQPRSQDEGLEHTCGSVQVVKGATEEDVWEVLRADPYAENVWDLEKTVIAPMKVGIIKPL